MAEILFKISKELYEKEAVLETAHIFTGEYYVDVIEGKGWQINLSPKQRDNPIAENIKGDFINRLLEQQIRIKMDKEFSVIRLEIVKKAFSPIAK